MKYTFDAIYKYLIKDKHVQSEIAREYGDSAQAIIAATVKGEDSDPTGVDLSSFLVELLHNDGRLYSRFTARGSYGNYHIDIKGLGGVYYYWAQEFGAAGYFLSVEEASDAINSNWTDSLTSNSGRVFRNPFVDESPGPSTGCSDSSQTAPARSRPKSDPAKRVLGYYFDEASGDIYWHSKYGPDHRTDISSMVQDAFSASVSDLRSALSKAQEIKWIGASRALKVICDAKKQITHLEREISKLKESRTTEIKVDSWLREHDISEPTEEDFKRMAAELRPFFRYRESLVSWNLEMPNVYRAAFLRLKAEHARILAERSRPDEE